MDDQTLFKVTLPDGTALELSGPQDYVERNKPSYEEIQNLLKATQQLGSRGKATSLLGTTNMRETGAVRSPAEDCKEGEYTGEEIKEFLAQNRIKSSPQILVAAFCYFLQVIKRRVTVGYTDLEECFVLAGLQMPDVKKAVGNCERRFRLVERDKDGQITITRIGRNWIEDPNRKDPAQVSRNAKKVPPSGANGANANKRKPSSIPKVKGNMNLFGGDSAEPFKDFVSSKKAQSNVEKFALAAYYTTQILGHSAFDESDVYTCFSHMGWKSPEYIRNNIINHKNMYGYYEMGKDGFKVTMKLKNFVEHDLKQEGGMR